MQSGMSDDFTCRRFYQPPVSRSPEEKTAGEEDRVRRKTGAKQIPELTIFLVGNGLIASVNDHLRFTGDEQNLD
jgi:hypothetical protein